MRRDRVRYLISAGIGAVVGGVFAVLAIGGHCGPGIPGQILELIAELPVELANLPLFWLGHGMESTSVLLAAAVVIWAVLGAGAAVVVRQAWSRVSSGTPAQRRTTVTLARVALAGLPIAAVCLWLLLGFLEFLGAAPDLFPDAPDLAAVSQLTHVRFPTGAVLVSSRYYSGFQIEAVLAKVAMAPDAVPALKKALGEVGNVTQTEVSTSDRLQVTNDSFVWLRPRPAGWDPDSHTEFEAFAMIIGQRDAELHVLICTDDPSKTLVYVLWCK